MTDPTSGDTTGSGPLLTVFEPQKGQKVPIHFWTRRPPKDAVQQLQRLATMPYVHRNVAAMADVHLSDAVAVGTVFATEQMLVPSALGGDLGCGVAALRFSIDAESLDRRSLDQLLQALITRIPVGEACQRGGGDERLHSLAVPLMSATLSTGALEHVRERQLLRQLGTLGGGNHFLELERDTEGWLWAVVHTGSRGLGGAIASHHGKAAGPEPLAGLNLQTDAGNAYLTDLDFAQQFARANRRAILDAVASLLLDMTGAHPDEDSRIDIHHNHIQREVHDGKPLWVHRKGATCVPAGARGIIPGSMGTATYLVEGLGCALAFNSCSHGAGRVMTRREARAKVRPQALEHSLRRVAFDRRRLSSLVEEAPSAYRDIRAVLDDQQHLITPRLRLEPLLVLKG